MGAAGDRQAGNNPGPMQDSETIGPEYGFYRPAPEDVVPDEGEVANGQDKGFSQNSRDKHIRENNETEF